MVVLIPWELLGRNGQVVLARAGIKEQAVRRVTRKQQEGGEQRPKGRWSLLRTVSVQAGAPKPPDRSP